MNALESLKRQASSAAADAGQLALSREAGHQLLNGHKEVVAALKQQQHELRNLRHDVNRRRTGGGFPWTLVVLAGAGYALYRSNAGVRSRIDRLLGTVDPGIQGNLHRAGDAARDAVHDVAQGDSPSDAVRRAAGEVQRAGEKAAGRAGDAWQDLEDSARSAADDIKTSSSKGIA